MKFARYAWFTLAYNLMVILWGAYVRASGSGAGCGSHWPLCNGEVIPVNPQIETIVEFAHRLSSGLALLLVLGMVVWAWRIFPSDHPVRLGSGLSLFLEITEALVGALLVRFEWVADNVSMGRVVSISVHLVNTFLLVAALVLTAWWASGGRRPRWRGQGMVLWVFGAGVLGMLLLGVSGAITALGDTLFPAQSLAEGLAQDFSETAHFLVRLRIWHPVLAIVVSFCLVFSAGLIAAFREQAAARRFAWLLGGLFAVQLVAGLINVLLLAPIWMQLVHLLLADAVWITFVLFAATILQDVPEKPVT